MSALSQISTLGGHSYADPVVSRRQLLSGVLAVGLAGLSACTPGSGVDPDRADATCVARDQLERRRTIAGLPLIYEPSGGRSNFWFDASFAGQLDAWAAELSQHLGGRVRQLATYGSWIDGRGSCDSWHHSGRAFDLARIIVTDGRVVSCRYDVWRTAPPTELEATRRAYWAVAAGLHLRFAYVLTYLHDARHANHIHLDNGRSGADLSTFAPRSRVQVQAVQAMVSYLWSDPVEINGRWDSPTRAASRRALDQLEIDADLTDGNESWHGFLRGTIARAGG
jgi:Extensin-like protein C-terminus